MEEVLKDPAGVCVYIAPTKALVNQVAGKRSNLSLKEIDVTMISSDDPRQIRWCVWHFHTRFPDEFGHMPNPGH